MMDGEMNRHGGSATNMATAADERESAITDAAIDALTAATGGAMVECLCPACDLIVENTAAAKLAHARSCEALRGQVTP